MSTPKRYPWLELLQNQLEEAVAAKKQKARIHTVIVHTDKWWCVYANISMEVPRNDVRATLKTVRKSLKNLWPKKFCVPPENGHDRTSMGPLDYGMEYNFEFWLPAQKRTPKDFLVFSDPTRKRKR